jgi:hypothetical protein
MASAGIIQRAARAATLKWASRLAILASFAAVACSPAEPVTVSPTRIDLLRVRGTISASPGHQVAAPGELRTSTIRWTTAALWTIGATTAQVWVSHDDRPEQLFAEALSGTQAAPWIQAPGRYVFKLYAGTARARLLAWTSVTTQPAPASRLGLNYWPQGYGPDALTDANWRTLRPIVAADLDQIASLGGGVVRLMFWPELSGFHLGGKGGGGQFTPELDEEARNLVDLLSLAYARGIQAIIVFGNSYFDGGNGQPGHRWWQDAYASFTPFLADTKRWVDTIVNAVEGSPYRGDVIYYDYENEYFTDHPNMGLYLTYLYDGSAVPMGKRGVSLLNVAHDLDDLRHQLDSAVGPELGRRRLDFVDFHSYPPGLNPDVKASRDAVQALFPDSTVLLGEFGGEAATAAAEDAQQQVVVDVVAKARANGVPYYLNWMLWDDTPAPSLKFAWAYDRHRPKNALGAVVAASSLVANADFEQRNGAVPAAWSAGGTVPVELFAMGPARSDAATNGSYGRVRVQTAGNAWLSSSPFAVTHGGPLFVDAYIRSNMKWASVDVHEYDASMHELRMTEGRPFAPTGWSYNNYLQRVGSFSVWLGSDTRFVVVAVGGETGAELPAYLDVDTVSVSQQLPLGPPAVQAFSFPYSGSFLANAFGAFGASGNTVMIFGGPIWPSTLTPAPFVAVELDGGGAVREVTPALIPAAPRAVHAREGVAVDLNGDGKLDYFGANHGYDADPFPGERQTLLLSQPNGTLQDASASLPPLINFTHSTAAGDVRNNGKIDILVGVLGMQSNAPLPPIYAGPNTAGDWVGPYLLRNDGQGHFTYDNSSLPARVANSFANGDSTFTSALFVDVDGDGWSDLVLGSDQNNPTAGRYYPNDKAGRFTTAEKLLPVGLFGANNTIVIDVAARDLDGDGRVDLVLAETPNAPEFYGGTRTQLLINDGAGGFRDETAARLPGQTGQGGWTQFIHFTDFDGDGYLDLFLQVDQPIPSGQPLLWRNDGTGHFTAAPGHLVPYPYASLTPIDFDRDGRVDLVSFRKSSRDTMTVTTYRR